MKTVMKKMFSLLLVAVLLVGVMPFQAFADGVVPVRVNGVTVDWIAPGSYSVDYFAKYCPEGTVVDYLNLCHTPDTHASYNAYSGSVSEGQCIHVNVKTKPVEYCGTCGAVKHDGLCEGQCGTCKKLNGHELTCSATYYVECCGAAKTAGHAATCSVAYYVECCGALKSSGHATTCTSGCDETKDCDWDYTHLPTCKSLIICSYCKGKGHTADDGTCPELYCACGARNADKLHPAECTLVYDCCGGNETTKSHTSDCPTYYACCGAAKSGSHKADCTQYFSCCNSAKDDGHATTCTQYYYCCGEPKTGNHKSGCTSQKCPEPGCNSYNGHPGNCTNEPEEIPGDSYLVVNVNLYTADVKVKTYELIRYENISRETRVYSFIADHAEQIKAKLPAGYNWSGNVYHAENDKDAELMNATLGNGRTVYINAYTGQNRVYIYVHNARTFSNIRVIQMNGKKINDTVTRKEVTALVDDYYHLNSLSMYSEDDWEKYVKNSDVQSVDSLTLHEDVTEIHVRISGSSRGTSYTADSTNPKTGDMIFTPVIIMGASVSALAVLFYLNKKRAF